ncbi:MAG: helix-turn-helix domain-containing protein [Rubrobacteraceae bacterium]
MGENENFHEQDGAAQIGLTLQQARQERGLSYEDAERDTKIRVRYLEAMERNDYEALPGVVYAQGFLKTYANYLDLDGERLAQEFKDRQSTSPLSQDSNVRSVRAERRQDRPGAARFRRRHNRLSPLVIIGAVLTLVLLVIVVGVLYFVGLQASRSTEGAQSSEPQRAENAGASEQGNASQNSEGGSSGGESGAGAGEDGTAQEQPSPQETEKPDAGGAGEEAAAEPSPSPEPAQSEAAASEPPPPESLTMEVRVEGNISWLNIEADGNVVFVEVAESGFVQTFEAEESITVWSGNAGAVFLSVNGQDYGQFGESGQTKIQEFNLKTAEN